MEEFINIPVPNGNEPFAVNLAGISYCDKSYHIYRPNSSVMCIEYVISGSGTLKTQGKTFYPHAGDTYLLLPEEYHEYYPDPDDPWVKIWFNSDGALINPLIDMYKLRKHTVFHCNSYDYIKKMHDTLSAQNKTPQERKDLATLIFHELIQFLKRNTTDKSSISADAETIKNYLDSHIYAKVNIEEISQLINKSPAQSIRIFKQSFNKTPYDYHLENKISKAIIFLENTSLSVKEIAYKLGFCDEHYFSGLIKSKTGKKPTEYRKKQLDA